MSGYEGLRSGELAAAAGVNAQTLRYYERRGLLAEPERTLGGHRLYPAAAVTVLRVIKAAQRLGSRWRRSPTCWRRPGTGTAATDWPSAPASS
ncbi:MerR family DNA-binding transcriptional regulator [Actinocorallia herbida]|uniref:MerR family DNA-binding transcriptional regulator n=1 Tax=Actinocorallia herbida TaxID=58109 RepID=UPI002482B851|nr:MerR family DNA-binding transcriptional regulator [Actinocorallia herbida]